MATTIDTAPATSYLVVDDDPADTITVADGPPESGFQTTEVSYGAGASAVIFANKTDFTLDGDGQGDKVSFDNPDPAALLTAQIIQNLGAGSTNTGVNPNAGSPDSAAAAHANGHAQCPDQHRWDFHQQQRRGVALPRQRFSLSVRDL